MSRALIYGSVSGKRLMDLSPIGVVNGLPVYPLHGAEDDADSGGDDGADDEEDEEEDGDEEDEEDSSSKDKGKGKTRQRSAAKNTAFSTMRRELNALKREKAARDKADRERELKEKPELERLTAEKEDLAKERERLLEQRSEAVIAREIIQKSLKKYDWADIEDVLNDKKVRAAIEIDDDGEISGVEEALKDLAKRKPHFLASKSEKDDEGKGKGNGKATTNGAGTGKTGEHVGNGSTSDRSSDRERLMKSYPTLTHMVES